MVGFDIFYPQAERPGDRPAPYRRYWASVCGTLVCIGCGPCQPGDVK
jgi:hypothetical protein